MHRLSLLSMFVAIPILVQGQDIPDQDSIRALEAPQVVVIAQKDRLLSSVPGAASYVKPLTLRRIAPLTGNEVFRKLPGINVVEEEGLGLRANIGIRGLNPDRSANVLVLEDGIPVQLNPYGEPELYYTPAIDRMSAIEVVKGSGQVMFGPRTIGGVINYITADPPAQAETRLGLKGGSGGFFGAQLGYGTTVGNTGIHANYLYKRADKIGLTGFDIHDLNLKINLRMSDKSYLGVKIQAYDEMSNATYIGLTQGMFEAGDYYRVMAPDDQLRIRRYALAATHKYYFTPALKLVTNAYMYTINRNWRRQQFSSNPLSVGQTGVVWGDPGIPGGAIYLLNQALYRNRTFEVGGLESRLNWKYRLGEHISHLDAGIRFHTESALEQEVLGNSPQARTGQLVNHESRPGHAYSGFVQNKFQLNTKLALSAGLRIEDYHFSREVLLYRAADGQYRDTLIEAPGHVSTLIPGIGLNYELGGVATLFGGAHKGFAPPSIKNSVSKSGEVFPLDAQQSWNYELGVRAAFSRGIDAELTGFWLDFSKQVIPVSESSGGSGSGFANAGNTLHRGIETSVRIDAGKLLNVDWSLYWEGNLTWVDAFYNADRFIGAEKTNVKNNRLPYAPEWLSTQSIGFAVPWGLDLQLSGSYTGKQYTDERNTLTPSADGRTGLIPAFLVLDASARYEPADWKTTFFITIKNLGDERYIASRRPQGIRAGIPRTLVAGVEKRF